MCSVLAPPSAHIFPVRRRRALFVKPHFGCAQLNKAPLNSRDGAGNHDLVVGIETIWVTSTTVETAAAKASVLLSA